VMILNNASLFVLRTLDSNGSTLGMATFSPLVSGTAISVASKKNCTSYIYYNDPYDATVGNTQDSGNAKRFMNNQMAIYGKLTIPVMARNFTFYGM